MNKKISVTLIFLFVLFIFFFAALFWILPDNSVSEQENRTLTRFPAFTFQRLFDGSFNTEMNSYYADQFPFRDFFVGIKGISETVSLKGENNGVLIGKNGQLGVRKYNIYKSKLEQIPDMDYYSSNNVSLSVKALNDYSASVSCPLVTLLPPRTIDVCASAFGYPAEISDALYFQLKDEISSETGWIDLLPLFSEKYNSGEKVYQKTDHHWTGCGAYLAYCEVMKAFGMSDDIISADSFSVENVPFFYGTSWSKAGMKFVAPDNLEIWSLGNDDDFQTDCINNRTVKNKDGSLERKKEIYKSFSGWLNREKLNTKDKYGAFLDGSHNELTVTKITGDGVGNRPKLLIAKDSFANCMVPYLVQHFDLVIVNLAAKMTDLSVYAEEYSVDYILIVYNWENLITGNNLALIK